MTHSVFNLIVLLGSSLRPKKCMKESIINPRRQLLFIRVKLQKKKGVIDLSL